MVRMYSESCCIWFGVRIGGSFNVFILKVMIDYRGLLIRKLYGGEIDRSGLLWCIRVFLMYLC